MISLVIGIQTSESQDDDHHHPTLTRSHIYPISQTQRFNLPVIGPKPPLVTLQSHIKINKSSIGRDDEKLGKNKPKVVDGQGLTEGRDTIGYSKPVSSFHRSRPGHPNLGNTEQPPGQILDRYVRARLMNSVSSGSQVTSFTWSRFPQKSSQLVALLNHSVKQATSESLGQVYPLTLPYCIKQSSTDLNLMEESCA